MASLGFLTSLYDPQPQQADQAPMVVALDEIKRRRERAQKSFEKATDTSPILSGWQGLARVAQALNGAIDDYIARRDERASREAADREYRGDAPSAAAGNPQAAAPAPSAAPANLSAPTDIENSFVDGVRKAGLTNPIGLGAVAATGKAESGYSPQNVNRTWSDPSQSGQPGTAGGIMSWRADRLQGLHRFAAERGEQPGNISPATQAAYFASEDPTLIPRLNAAKTPDEANRIMANAWRFAGYDQPGGETARRLALTQAYSQRFGGQAGPAPAIPVQVAENEADVRRLEAQQGNPVVDGPAGSAQPTQTAQADVPAPGASEAQGFAVPGQTGAQPGGMFGLTPSRALQILSGPTFEHLPAGRKMVVQAMAQRAIALSAKDPLEREKMTLEIAKMRKEAAQGDRGVTMGSRLVDPRTGKVIADFTEADAAGPGKFGLNPVYGQDGSGNTVMLQTNDKGEAVATKLPDGVKVSGGIEKLDGGTNWILLDKRTGNVIGTEKKDIAGAEREKVVGKQEGEAQMSLPSALASAEQSLATIDAVRKHPGRDGWGATGWTSTLPVIGGGAAGTEARDFVNLVDQLKGQTFLQAFNTLKGGGAITDIEGAKGTQALARLDRAQSKKGFDEALNDLEAVVRGGIARAKAKAGGNAAAAAPTVDTSKPGSFRYNPATGKMELM
ncbi:hypothetical protein [uncultured Bosea sp.]|uniref:hypothetical protein n=1 Tax=uncultured Bosea sp. TaxID=211457 RepID=UPI0025F32A81|nr:hypothetical protein [uncultured Bosea sp.]